MPYTEGGKRRKIRVKGDGSVFLEGDLIIYGNYGGCLVEKVEEQETPEKSQSLYYTLRPCYMRESVIRTPADNPKVIMRPILTKEEVLGLIDEMKDISPLWIEDEKKREEAYKEALKTCEPRSLIQVIKTIYNRKNSRLSEGKKITHTDDKYFRFAEERLYGEFALALGMTKDDIHEFIEEKIDNKLEDTTAEPSEA